MKALFNVRIYGILIENHHVLVSDELHFNKLITKFPGGGLQFGEGTIDCLKREFREELNIDVDIHRHFYTVDFFQPSAFDSSQQVISIYYLVGSLQSGLIQAHMERPLNKNLPENFQAFRWLPISKLKQDDFTFPIDQKVSELLTLDSQG